MLLQAGHLGLAMAGELLNSNSSPAPFAKPRCALFAASQLPLLNKKALPSSGASPLCSCKQGIRDWLLTGELLR